MSQRTPTTVLITRTNRWWVQMGMPRAIRHQRRALLGQQVSAFPALVNVDPYFLAESWAGDNRRLRVRAAWVQCAATILIVVAAVSLITYAITARSQVSLVVIAGITAASIGGLVRQSWFATRGPAVTAPSRSLMLVCSLVVTWVACGATSYSTIEEIDVPLFWMIGLAIVGMTLALQAHRLRAAWR